MVNLGTRPSGFGPAGEYPVRPRAAGLYRFILILTFISDSAKVPPLISLIRTDSGMLSACVGRCQPKSDLLSV